jgi:tRNA1Val (adenine37-N6)-methyltransferase
MKIGTDAVLLGSWCPFKKTSFSALDIGSGTGILALMLAQRSNAEHIDAIEIEENAYEQCVNNFEESPWNDRLFCYHASLSEFVEEMEDETYDIIISNPPFYNEDYYSNNDSRDTARFTYALPFEELIESASKLITENGTFAVIIPHKEEDTFIHIAKENNLYPYKITRVKGTPNSEIKRSLIAFTKSRNLLKLTN